MSVGNQKIIISSLVLLSAGYFALFCLPNAAASSDTKMVLMFQPDEAYPLPYVFDMIKPAATLKQALINFAFYDYYYYGYPYFAASGLVLLPLSWMGQLSNTTLVMLLLRQIISVLPLLAAIWVLVYLQTRFKTYKAIVIFLLLAALPAVTRNNFWWHPDGLAILFSSLALCFLYLDDLRFGGRFYLSAALCGISAMTKGIGFFFFLAVIVYLLFGLFNKKIRPVKLLFAAAGYLLVMGVAYFASNPSLIYPGIRESFFETMSRQSELLMQGYEVYYQKGLIASLPELVTNFGGLPILIIALAAGIHGIIRGPNRLLPSLILAWLIPLSIMDFFIIHFKFQYWLPVALPLLSCLGMIFPERLDLKDLLLRFKSGTSTKRAFVVIRSILAVVILVQFAGYVSSDITLYSTQLRREENSEAINFFDRAKESLAALPRETMVVYHDARMYVPESTGWQTDTIFEVLTYPYIQGWDFDILMIMQSRIYDYLNDSVVGIDPDRLALGREFYQDAADETVEGYRLVYRDEFGLIFVKESLYNEYFAS